MASLRISLQRTFSHSILSHPSWPDSLSLSLSLFLSFSVFPDPPDCRLTCCVLLSINPTTTLLQHLSPKRTEKKTWMYMDAGQLSNQSYLHCVGSSAHISSNKRNPTGIEGDMKGTRSEFTFKGCCGVDSDCLSKG